MPAWADEIAAIAADHDAGSWVLTQRAAGALAGAARAGEASLRVAIQRLVVTQPAMAGLWNLANAVAWAATNGYDPAAAAERVIVDGATHLAAIARRAAALLGTRRAVTISAGATVEAALRAGRGPGLILESRPRCEGARLAERLAAAGMTVTLAVDAAGWALLGPDDVVLLGADSVSPDGVTNKIGSWSLAAGARVHGIACYVLAGEEKWWPVSLPLPADRAASQVLPDPPAGLRVANPTFERVPLALVTAIVTADGLRSPDDVVRALVRWQRHPWLLELGQ